MNSESPQDYAVVFWTDIATIGLRFDGSRLIKIDYLKKTPVKAASNKQAQAVKNKIEKYLKPGSKTKNINADIKLNVTPFQEKVLNQLLQIPYGETRSYGEIAKILKTSPRAVGNACRHNPLPIIIPCHRVVAANGIGGYSGETAGSMLDIKRRLLQLEGVI
ncbi:MAG: MGMT family protein [Gammaproteobacteria bacterium]|nr:MGMT family protein [Gammaproteobacteria bacterium]